MKRTMVFLGILITFLSGCIPNNQQSLRSEKIDKEIITESTGNGNCYQKLKGIPEYGKYFIESGNVYFVSDLDKYNKNKDINEIAIISGIDIDTVKMVGNYIIDKNSVWVGIPYYPVEVKKLNDADPNTFTLIERYGAKDKKYIYNNIGDKVNGADPATFQILVFNGATISKDKNNIYLYDDILGKKYYKNAPESMKKKLVWKNDIDLNSLEAVKEKVSEYGCYMETDYLKDKNNVYYLEKAFLVIKKREDTGIPFDSDSFYIYPRNLKEMKSVISIIGDKNGLYNTFYGKSFQHNNDRK